MPNNLAYTKPYASTEGQIKIFFYKSFLKACVGASRGIYISQNPKLFRNRPKKVRNFSEIFKIFLINFGWTIDILTKRYSHETFWQNINYSHKIFSKNIFFFMNSQNFSEKSLNLTNYSVTQDPEYGQILTPAYISISVMVMSTKLNFCEFLECVYLSNSYVSIIYEF